MKPKALSTGASSARIEALTTTARDLWSLCDGTRDIPQLAALLEIEQRVLFTELDSLADAGLLEARQSPPSNQLATSLPGGMSRREALAKLALGAAGGFAALSIGARPGFAQDKLDSATKDDQATIDKEKGDALEGEIATIEKRLQERQVKRKEALDCRRKQTDKNKVSEENAKATSCANPGQLQTEIANDKQLLLQKRRVERKVKQKQTHLERSKKKQSS